MACCYIAASMIAFIIQSCDALDINLNLQYNESIQPHHEKSLSDREVVDQDKPIKAGDSGVTVISITGMTCAACLATVEKSLLDVPGVSQALVSIVFHEARVFHREDIFITKLTSAIEDAGYGATVGERQTTAKINALKNSEELAVLRTALNGLGFYSSLVFSLGKGPDWMGWSPSWKGLVLARDIALMALTAFAAMRKGNWIFERAWQAALSGHANMHTLITTSAIIGLSLSALSIWHGTGRYYFDSIMGILLIITVGRYIDLISRRQAANTFVGLYSILDETSTIKLAKLDKRVPAHVGRVGDAIIIEPYSIIPCDSYVVDGTSHANEAIITGESIPRSKAVGDLLLAGSRNGPNRLSARIHQSQEGSFLSQLVHSIETALTSKGASHRWVDTVTMYFVHTIFAIAAVATVVEFCEASHNGIGVAVQLAGEKTMTILAAACPCALGLATPCAVMAGIDIAWRNGILMLQGGESMELARRVKHVVLDKTGTLTVGTPSVKEMAVNSEWENRPDELAVAICSAEEDGIGGHPLASAVFRRLLPMCGKAWDEFQMHGSKTNLESVHGRGVKCRVRMTATGQWRTVVVGSLEYMQAEGIKEVESLGNRMLEGSIVFAGIDGKLAASMVLRDTVKDDAKESIDALRSLGIEVCMLTGDNLFEARRIACELGVPLAGADATPDVKLIHIKRLQANGSRVMMVGDGMNDGPSLAAADVGVMMAHGKKCMSSGGSVLILQSDLKSLIKMMHICRSTMRQVSANVAWAILYNTAAVGLALGLGKPYGIEISPSIAAAMMSFSSVSITLSGVLLRVSLSRQIKRL